MQGLLTKPYMQVKKRIGKDAVLYLPLYDPGTQGNTIISRDRYHHSCAVIGALWTPQGRSFDGVDDEVYCAVDSPPNILGALTVSCWVKLTVAIASQPDEQPNLLAKRSTGTADRNFTFLIDRATDTLHFQGRDDADNIVFSSSVAGIGATYLDDLAWHEITGVWDRANTTSCIYIDSIARSTDTGQADSDLNATNTRFTVGSGSRAAGTFAKAAVGDVLLYSRALSPIEVQRDYLATRWRYQ